MSAAPDDALLGRLRALLAGEPDVREVRMMGGRAVMVDDAMIAHVRSDGHLMVRVDPERADELLALPGAAPARISRARPMGRGWITVAPEHLEGDDALAFWFDACMAYRRH